MLRAYQQFKSMSGNGIILTMKTGLGKAHSKNLKKPMTTLERLQAKSEMTGSIRMPSIQDIHKLLTDNNIQHTYRDSTNVVEHRSKGNRYVNSRHNGKDGKNLTIVLSTEEQEYVGRRVIELDTSDSYYSANSDMYARQLIKLLTFKNKK